MDSFEPFSCSPTTSPSNDTLELPYSSAHSASDDEPVFERVQARRIPSLSIKFFYPGKLYP
ncbi:hypothetical protein AURDEDRAFT_167259 [Auricularia subglabra TFB-10046 SS5]|nr:hypothetical protein AURDEDRAFT_167259 [Auricularia subglabra TFB-10046 SS5]